MPKIKAFLLELRAPFLTVTIIPVLLGTAFAKYNGLKISWFYFMWAMAGFVFMHLGTNVLNDYFDHKNGTDNVNKEFVSPFTGGSRLIQSGILKPSEVFVEGLLMFAAGSAIGIYLGLAKGTIILWIWLFAFISGFFYVAPPFKWAHRGLGELLIFLNFGPVITVVSYYIQGGTISFAPVLASIMPGLLAAAIVDINQFPDYNADKETGKRNLVVRLGRERARFFHASLIIAAYIPVIAGAAAGIFSLWSLLVLFIMPLGLNATAELMKNFDNPGKLASACGKTIATHLFSGIIFTLVFFIL